jgi:hypothetical protein
VLALSEGSENPEGRRNSIQFNTKKGGRKGKKNWLNCPLNPKVDS